MASGGGPGSEGPGPGSGKASGLPIGWEAPCSPPRTSEGRSPFPQRGRAIHGVGAGFHVAMGINLIIRVIFWGEPRGLDRRQRSMNATPGFGMWTGTKPDRVTGGQWRAPVSRLVVVGARSGPAEKAGRASSQVALQPSSGSFKPLRR